jgi:electron transport complex protein RnfD
MANFLVSGAPHIKNKLSTRRLMGDVLIALIPALTASVLFSGPWALLLAAVCMAAAAAAEFLFGLLREWRFTAEAVKGSSVFDLSSLVTGLLLALNLPVTVPLWAACAASVFAIAVVKMLFGGLGKNFVNPALMGRIFLIISLSRIMGSAVGTNNILGIEDVTGATWLSDARIADPAAHPLWGMLLGNTPSAAMGETSAVAILIGFIYLVIRKVIDFKLPLIIIGGTALFVFLFDCLPNYGAGDWGYVVAAHLLSGGLLLGAVFMATDYSTSPNTQAGIVIYGAGIAVLTALIRVFGALPEGVSFAITIMNLVSVLLDKFIRPKFFGKQKPPKKIGVKEAKAA